jgi:hypothetical protein
LRIFVEMAFGWLVSKFRILNGKIEGSLERISSVLLARAWLHNFIICEDEMIAKFMKSGTRKRSSLVLLCLTKK